MRKIELTKGQFTLVDDNDFEWLNQFKWSCQKGNKYAARRTNNRIIYMHRFIVNCPEKKEVDHINGNGLDNQRNNLRIVTSHQNHFNHKLIKTNKTGYHGVYWDKQMEKWGVGISIQGKHKALGYYNNIKEAASTYNKAAILYRGDFARLNNIEGMVN